MNSLLLVLSPNAYRLVPGVYTPVAAVNWAVTLTSRATCSSVRPSTAGNWRRRGCSAALSSSRPEREGREPGDCCEDDVGVTGSGLLGAPPAKWLVMDPHPLSIKAAARTGPSTRTLIAHGATGVGLNHAVQPPATRAARPW